MGRNCLNEPFGVLPTSVGEGVMVDTTVEEGVIVPVAVATIVAVAVGEPGV